MRGTIVIAGSIAQKPGQGGHAWVFLQYVLGLRRLGWDVLFLDRLEPEMCVDERGRSCPADRSINVRYFCEIMRRFGLDGAYALFARGRGSEETYGLDRRRAVARARDAELLLNVMGFIDDEEIMATARRRVFLDIDPGFGQMWCALGWANVFDGHDDFVTIGSNIGRPDCSIPDCGLEWITTKPPLVLEHWPARPPVDGPFTSIGAWRGPWAPIEYGGETYGLRAHTFREFAELPRLSGSRFEIALDIDPAEDADLSLLARNGWTLVEPLEVAGDPWSYQRYIAGSGGEFMVAKDMYVRSNSGWFSDRSVCYLASARPVVALNTSLGEDYPTGEGLVPFSTLEEAQTAIEEVSRDRVRHSRAARRVAEEFFDSDTVLTRLLERLGVERP